MSEPTPPPGAVLIRTLPASARLCDSRFEDELAWRVAELPGLQAALLEDRHFGCDEARWKLARDP